MAVGVTESGKKEMTNNHKKSGNVKSKHAVEQIRKVNKKKDKPSYEKVDKPSSVIGGKLKKQPGQLKSKTKIKSKTESQNDIEKDLDKSINGVNSNSSPKSKLPRSTVTSDNEGSNLQVKKPLMLKKKKRGGKKKTKPQTLTNIPQLCIEYLNKWKNDHSNWKFEKARQIRLISMALDKEKLPKEQFEVFLEYMMKASDRSKSQLASKAKEVISSVETYENLSEQEKLETSKPEKAFKCYQRARKLVQLFD